MLISNEELGGSKSHGLRACLGTTISESIDMSTDRIPEEAHEVCRLEGCVTRARPSRALRETSILRNAARTTQRF